MIKNFNKVQITLIVLNQHQ